MKTDLPSCIPDDIVSFYHSGSEGGNNHRVRAGFGGRWSDWGKDLCPQVSSFRSVWTRSWLKQVTVRLWLGRGQSDDREPRRLASSPRKASSFTAAEWSPRDGASAHTLFLLTGGLSARAA